VKDKIWGFCLSFFVCVVLLHIAVMKLMEIWHILLIIGLLILAVIVYFRFKNSRPKY